MTSVIIYASIWVSQTLLQTFAYPGFKQLAHGEFKTPTRTLWYVYGEFDTLIWPQQHQQVLKDAVALCALIWRAKNAESLMALYKAFATHVGTDESDIECDDVEPSDLQKAIALLYKEETKKRAEAKLV
jgi:hypothetical protein